MRAQRLVVSAGTLLTMLTLVASLPLGAAAVTGWSLSAAPDVLPTGHATTVTFHLTDTAERVRRRAPNGERERPQLRD
jgi:hypothetical protein